MAVMSRLRVVTWNVRYFGHATRGIAATRGGMRRIAASLADLAPLADVVCLQEVETASVRATLVQPVGDEGTQLGRFTSALHAALAGKGLRDRYHAMYFPAHAYQLGRTPLYTTGLAVLVRDGIHVTRHNAEAPEDITHRRIATVSNLKQTRVCAHVRVRTDAGDVDVFNTHLSLPAAFTPEFWTEPRRLGWGKNQIEEAKALQRFVDQTRAGSAGFVVLGDFNSLPGSPVYKHFVGESRYKDAFGEFYRMTHDELRAFPTAGFLNMRMHLDHVFSGPGIVWHDFDHTSAFGDRTSPFHRLSDHMLIIGSCSIGG